MKFCTDYPKMPNVEIICGFLIKQFQFSTKIKAEGKEALRCAHSEASRLSTSPKTEPIP